MKAGLRRTCGGLGYTDGFRGTQHRGGGGQRYTNEGGRDTQYGYEEE